VMQHALLRVAHAYNNAEGVERQVCTGPHLAPDAHLTPGCARAVAIGVRAVNAFSEGDEHLYRFSPDQIHKFEEYNRKAGG
jgi:hypothetical protein